MFVVDHCTNMKGKEQNRQPGSSSWKGDDSVLGGRIADAACMWAVAVCNCVEI